MTWVEVEYPERTFKYYAQEWVEFRDSHIERWNRGECKINGMTYQDYQDGKEAYIQVQ